MLAGWVKCRKWNERHMIVPTAIGTRQLEEDGVCGWIEIRQDTTLIVVLASSGAYRKQASRWTAGDDDKFTGCLSKRTSDATRAFAAPAIQGRD